MSEDILLDEIIGEDLLLGEDQEGLVTVRICDQLFGVSVLAVRDVLRKLAIAKVPLAPDVVAGSLNLRGRIVTVVDMRKRLGLPPLDDYSNAMHVVVEHNDELYSLMVDSVGDVLNLPISKMEKSPPNLDQAWRDLVSNVCQLENDLLVILDVQSILTFSS